MIKRQLFSVLFLLYIAILSIIFCLKWQHGSGWWESIFFDKFYVFQLMPAIILGLAIENTHFNTFTHVRFGNRKTILKNQFLHYYERSFYFVSMTFVVMLIGSVLLSTTKEAISVWLMLDRYIHYVLGTFLFVNLMLCFQGINCAIFQRYSQLLVFLWLIFEVIILPKYVQSHFGVSIYFAFLWIFHSGLMGYIVLLLWLMGTAFIANKLYTKRDFL